MVYERSQGFTPVDSCFWHDLVGTVKHIHQPSQPQAHGLVEKPKTWQPDFWLPKPGAPVADTRLPEFLRLPKPGTLCPLTGLSRSTLNALILGPSPAVRSVCLRRPGALKGIRLIPTAALLAYLHGQIDSHSTNPEKGGSR